MTKRIKTHIVTCLYLSVCTLFCMPLILWPDIAVLVVIFAVFLALGVLGYIAVYDWISTWLS